MALSPQANYTDWVNKNTETLIDASKEVGLEVNIETTKCMFVSRDQNQDIKIANRSFEIFFTV
jgi:hypothetical protein